MNETAREALERMITMAVDGMEGAAAFAEAEIPAVIEQLLTWKLIESLLHTVLPLIITMVLAAGLFKAVTAMHRAQQSRDNDDRPPFRTNFWWDRQGPSVFGVLIIAVLFLAALVSTIVTIIEANLDWLYITIAPKVYLLEYAADLIK